MGKVGVAANVAPPLFASTPKDAFAASAKLLRFNYAQQGTDASFNALMNQPKM